MKESSRLWLLFRLFQRAAEHSAVVGRWSRTAILERGAVKYLDLTEAALRQKSGRFVRKGGAE